MERMDMNHVSVRPLGTPSKKDITIGKKTKVRAPESTHFIFAHCNIGRNEITYFPSYKDSWIIYRFSLLSFSSWASNSFSLFLNFVNSKS